MDFRTGNLDNHVGWCELGDGEEMVAVLGHLDVVPAAQQTVQQPDHYEALLRGALSGITDRLVCIND